MAQPPVQALRSVALVVVGVVAAVALGLARHSPLRWSAHGTRHDQRPMDGHRWYEQCHRQFH